MSASLVDCELAGRCSGCSWILQPWEEQRAAKTAQLRDLWRQQGLPPLDDGAPRIEMIATAGLRDRVDLIFRAGSLGLYDVDRREILALGSCPQMSAALREWFLDFRSDPPPIVQGSLRLRVSPEGTWGVWLDFANTDVKKLLDEGSWLRRLATRAVVEIGQKRKRLVDKEGRLALGPPELAPWMNTYLGDKPQALYTAIGSFTQVGDAANRALVSALVQLLPAVEGRWVELGAGAGNFTLPLAAAGASEVIAIENDVLAGEGLLRAAREAGLADRIAWREASFQQPKGLEEIVRGARGILADPPRSGLGTFPELLAAIPVAERPRDFVYVSCYGESFVKDAASLSALGYRLCSIAGIDPFPQTPHVEILARFQLQG